jgi:radical SAM superfamily enzyme YgiQ (UPF0313 family)
MADFTLVHVNTPYLSSGEASKRFMPLGCLYLTANLQRHGFTVDFRDFQLAASAQDHDAQDLADFIEGSADIVGLSCMADHLPTVLLATSQIKDDYPEKTIVLGGPGPSDCPVSIMQEFRCIDAIAVGEAEVTIVELLQRLLGDRAADLTTVAGIVYRDGDQVRTSPPRPRIKDLDELPLPHPRGVDLTRYDEAHIISSRGCPYSCTFCDVAALWHRQTTFRSIDSLLAELRALYRLGFKQVSIQDDVFTLNQKRVRAFAERISAESNTPEWGCLGRVNLVDPDLLKLMADSGCTGVFYGIESGSDRVLAQICKEITAASSASAVATTLRYIGDVKTYFIWGYPQETLTDLTKTLLLMSYLSSMGAKTPLTLLSPLLRSSLYLANKDEIYLDRRLFRFNYVSGFRSDCSDEVFHLIRRHPELFASFYSYHNPQVEEKLRLVQQFKTINDLTMTQPAAN